jgi:dual specificity protein kinase YAK1
MVHLLSSFMFKSHLCLVFECLGMNLYEVLKRRQFRGLPLPMVRTLVKQAIEGVKELAGKTIVHCDLKPENILLVGGEIEKDVLGAGDKQHQQTQAQQPSRNSEGNSVASESPQTIKLIDFGSACFEGYSAHTYIQSRFYRSPEVLMGLPYDSAIDIWSLGCVAAELFLGLPILPGVHEHDQCGRIVEMINQIPDWMLEQGSKASKYYVKYVPRSNHSASSSSGGGSNADPKADSNNNRPMMPQWRMKTQEEYIKSLTQNEIRKKGGLAKLEKQPANRYFKRTKLCDIIMLHGQHGVDDKELLGTFVHFLYGTYRRNCSFATCRIYYSTIVLIVVFRLFVWFQNKYISGLLDPDPWKRWTAYQASQHPFITGMSGQLRKKTPETRLDYKEENQANCNFDIYWQPPWDPGICRRKLLNVQRMREKQNAQRRNYAQAAPSPSMNSLNSRGMVPDSPSVGHMSVDGKNSPPSEIADKEVLRQQQAQARRGMTAGSLPAGGVASSMSAIGNSGGLGGALGNENPTRTEQLMNPPPNPGKFMGPQSYTALGNFDDAPEQADFAYALQRPGNVPALSSSVASSVAAGGASVNSHMRQQQYHQHQQQQHQQYQHHSQQQHYRMHQGSMRDSMQGSLPKYNNGGTASSVNSLPGGYSNQAPGMIGGGSGVSYQGVGNSLGGIGGLSSSGLYDNQGGGVQYLAQQRELQKQQQQQQSRSKSQQMDPQMMTAYDHQLLIEQQQKQLAALQAQHQQQLAALQQQQQLAFQQQQQQYLSQQYGTTGNGYYYVTSADGTPMMVQGGAAQMGTSYDGSQGGSYRGMPQQQMGYGDAGGSRPGSMRDRQGHQGRMSGSHRGSYR